MGTLYSDWKLHKGCNSCKNESETTVNPIWSKDKMQVTQLEFKTASALVPTEEGRVQNVGNDGETVMSSDERH